jgi:AcrR family transcriptional regulator
MSTEIQTPPPRRRYEKRARASKEQETRQRILEAALALHGSLGPSRTTISAIAERAGVRRATVYRHFPDERALFLGCSGLSRERNPAPDPALWATIADPVERLDAALEQIYRWYARMEPLLTAVLRDIDTMPIIAELQGGRLAYLAAVEDGLAAGWGVRGTAAKRLRAAIGLALDFHSWRTLYLRGLGLDGEIAVMSSAVRASAGYAQ